LFPAYRQAGWWLDAGLLDNRLKTKDARLTLHSSLFAFHYFWTIKELRELSLFSATKAPRLKDPQTSLVFFFVI
jgi:hypothetical protein